MIPTIGMMMGFYIITRCMDMIFPGKMVTQILAALTILFAFIGIIALGVSGAK